MIICEKIDLVVTDDGWAKIDLNDGCATIRLISPHDAANAEPSELFGRPFVTMGLSDKAITQLCANLRTVAIATSNTEALAVLEGRNT